MPLRLLLRLLALAAALAPVGTTSGDGELTAWLGALKLGQFETRLRQEFGAAAPADLALLDAGDLAVLGLKKIHKIKLRKAIDELGQTELGQLQVELGLTEHQPELALQRGGECAQSDAAGGLRAGLDGSSVFRRGATMVHVYDAFLNNSEVAHMIQSGKRALRSQQERSGRLSSFYDSAFLDGPQATPELRDDETSRLVHERVARLTRIPVDPSDRQSVTMYAESVGSKLMNVHHDRNRL